jgi:hypothetical protein
MIEFRKTTDDKCFNVFDDKVFLGSLQFHEDNNPIFYCATGFIYLKYMNVIQEWQKNFSPEKK